MVNFKKVMKKTLVILMLLLYCKTVSFSQENLPNYNKALADSLGADAFGMKQYVFCILKTGTVKIDDKLKMNQLFVGHMENINKLANDGKLVVAGPFLKNDKEYRGLFILNVKTIEEAQKLLQTDPCIKEKIFEAELTPWYGSAALSEYLKIHKTIEKTKP
jgi:uncharacterized protein